MQLKRPQKSKEKRSAVAIIRDTIINVFMVAAILIFLLALYTMYKHQDDPNNAFLLGYKPVYVMTGSMEPTLRVNGIAIVKQAEYDEIELEDIIMYEIDDKMITHRVIEISDEGIRTKGDNNNVQDAYYLQPENIRGKVVSIWNWTATIVEQWKTKEGRTQITIIGIFVICAILFAIGMKMFLKQKKPTEPEETDSKYISNENSNAMAYGSPTEELTDTGADVPDITQNSPNKDIKKPEKPRHAISAEEAESTLYIAALVNIK